MDKHLLFKEILHMPRKERNAIQKQYYKDESFRKLVQGKSKILANCIQAISSASEQRDYIYSWQNTVANAGVDYSYLEPASATPAGEIQSSGVPLTGDFIFYFVVNQWPGWMQSNVATKPKFMISLVNNPTLKTQIGTAGTYVENNLTTNLATFSTYFGIQLTATTWGISAGAVADHDLNGTQAAISVVRSAPFSALTLTSPWASGSFGATSTLFPKGPIYFKFSYQNGIFSVTYLVPDIMNGGYIETNIVAPQAAVIPNTLYLNISTLNSIPLTGFMSGSTKKSFNFTITDSLPVAYPLDFNTYWLSAGGFSRHNYQIGGSRTAAANPPSATWSNRIGVSFIFQTTSWRMYLANSQKNAGSGIVSGIGLCFFAGTAEGTCFRNISASSNTVPTPTGTIGTVGSFFIIHTITSPTSAIFGSPGAPFTTANFTPFTYNTTNHLEPFGFMITYTVTGTNATLIILFIDPVTGNQFETMEVTGAVSAFQTFGIAPYEWGGSTNTLSWSPVIVPTLSDIISIN